MAEWDLSKGLEGLTDEQFLGYVDEHSRTDLALFHRDHVARLLTLAGVDLPTDLSRRDFWTVEHDVADVYIKMATTRLAKAAGATTSSAPLPEHC